ncbi:CHAT domain-containing protein [Paractinoplanes maris]|uniref:CHAT domain-containing protein n=1 Tax=Paractinoplanes maris TaxID=1734446 RepID=UPI0020225EA6|nr:CHAT domain-containing protein [Actinoplanes maris]
MPEDMPLDVRLRIADDHLVTLVVAGAGEARAPLGDALAAMADDPSWRAVLDRQVPKDVRESTGTALFEGAVRGPVATLWAGVEQAAAANRPVRVRLEIEPAPLRALPWELMRNGRWTFLRPRFTAWRSDPRSLPGEPIDGPLRVLIVVCNPADRQTLGDDEVSRVTRAVSVRLACTHVETLDGPDRDLLVKTIGSLRPHVLHFIGHGMPRIAGHAPFLAFNWATDAPAAGATPWELASDEIEMLLLPWTPRLVVVNACRTATDPLDQVGGLGEAFLSAGVGAVVSMQADVESPAAVRFSSALYGGIVRGQPLDQVMVEARSEVAMPGGETGEWATPVLTCRTDPAEVLRFEFQRPMASIEAQYAHHQYLCGFLDHADVRRDAWWALDPPWGDARSLVVVGGRSENESAQTGKTWFTKWCLLTYYLRGRRVTYVDLKAQLRPHRSGQTKDWLDTLRAIREAVVADSQPEPLPPATFADFNTTLNRLVNNAPEDEGPDDLWRRFDDDRPHAEDYRDQILDAFRTALGEACADRTHIIALDNADSILPEAFDDAIYPGLIRPIAASPGSATRLMVVASSEWLTGHLPRGDDDKARWSPVVQIGDFDRRQAMRLFRDYCGRIGQDFADLNGYFEMGLRKDPNVWVTRFQTVMMSLGIDAGQRR